MTDYIEKKCPKCDQQLRIPKDIGGVLMACPSCGEKFHSDFKLGGVRKNAQHGMLITVFEMPGKVIDRIARYFSSNF